MIENGQNIKTLILKMKVENEELKEKTRLMKSQIEELKELKKIAKVWESVERKWIKTLFNYKQQQEALNSHVKALTEEKKEKENVLIYLELINLKSDSLLNYEEIRRTTIEAKIKSQRKQIRNIKKIYSNYMHIWRVQMRGRKMQIQFV